MTETEMKSARAAYHETAAAIRQRFFSEPTYRGPEAIRARSDAADSLVQAAWAESVRASGRDNVALLATGGFGRQQLFPASDVDLLILLESAAGEKVWKDSIRRFTQNLWDSSLRVSATTRTLAECSRFDRDNLEFTLSLLDARPLAGDVALAQRLTGVEIETLIERERRSLSSGLVELTRERHGRYGQTIFHLEPNVKECPGGLRDTHVCGWLAQLSEGQRSAQSPEFTRAFAFEASVRCFLHYRQGRDVNALDWKAQDEAAAAGVGVDGETSRDPAYWMQLYFRHARTILRRLEQGVDALPRVKPILRVPQFLRRAAADTGDGLRVESGRLVLEKSLNFDAAQDFDTVLRAFAVLAESGLPMGKASEERIEAALPWLSPQMEEGEALWDHLHPILCGEFAGDALRSMHAQGVLELLLPEFHGIDALVIRDAYHRYTVDEHTFVLIATLHALAGPQQGPLAEWARRFAQLLKDLQHPALLYLAALLHDTGKGRATGDHTVESARLAKGVLARLDRDSYQSELVLQIIRNHLEMSAALRRDIFDAETVRAFAAKVQTPDELRMLTLFTYADICAVHPDALTPWKAENLWRLYISTANFLDRNVDEERVDARVSSDLVQRIVTGTGTGAAGGSPVNSRDLFQFLEGFPQRYLQTRGPEQIRSHFRMAAEVSADVVQTELAWRADRSELTVVTPDRRLLFACVAGVLAGWGMNIITADAFSNARGVVVDSFRFTDSFRTLELNPGERERLRQAVHDAVMDEEVAAKMLADRRRSRRRDPLMKVTTSIKFDTRSSSHSTLVQIVAQDHPGLLYSIAQTLGEARCNIEVALIDTEGETAIDVFYLTRDGAVLDEAGLPELEAKLLDAIGADAAAR